jgi:hypothetical protein
MVEGMKDWLIQITEITIVVIDAMALVLIIIATATTFIAALRTLFSGQQAALDRRTIWLHYALARCCPDATARCRHHRIVHRHQLGRRRPPRRRRSHPNLPQLLPRTRRG